MFVESAEHLNSLPDDGRCVIVGGGTLGIYLGVLLARQGREVVIIESGNRTLENFDPNSFECVGLPHEGIRIGRSRSLGGTSNLWGGQLVEFQEADLAGRDWLPDSRWPVSFEEVRRYFGTTYENLGIPESLQNDSALLDRLKSRIPAFSHDIEYFLTRWMKIPSTAEAFRKELEQNPRLTVVLNCTVNAFEASNGRITAVRAVDPQRRTCIISGNHFFLAAGTIETIRLLLHSAQSPEWSCPWKSNDNVGRFFQDHVGGRAASVHPLDRKQFLQWFSTIVSSGFKFQPKLRLTSKCLAREDILNVQGMLHFESSVSENLVFLKQFLKAAFSGGRLSGWKDLPRNVFACARFLPPLMMRYILQNRVFVPSGSKISFNLQSEQEPLRESRITISPQTIDKYGLPRIRLDWKFGEHQLRSMRDFTRRCKHALASAGIAELKLVPELEVLDGLFLSRIRDNYHHVGGARMGTTPDNGVVDSELRVFGTSNLYILGASTFRTTGNANTTFLALALATRLAARLAARSSP